MSEDIEICICKHSLYFEQRIRESNGGVCVKRKNNRNVGENARNGSKKGWPTS